MINALLTFINFLTPKKPRSVYLNVWPTFKDNDMTIINPNSNNALKFLSVLIRQRFVEPITVYLEYFDDEHMSAYEALASEVATNNVRLLFVRSYRDKTGLKRIGALIRKYRGLFHSRVWLVDTGDTPLHAKLKRQRLIDMNYFISCKNDYLPDDDQRWARLDGILTTSLLHSTTVSAQTGVKLRNCLQLGFPRNDTLFQKEKEEVVRAWLREELGYVPKKIIVYAPTYRDYRNKEMGEYSLFGYPFDGIEDYLKRNQFALVAKLHYLELKGHVSFPQGIVNFKICYDFSFYDLMAIADCVITDYSSLGYDYLLLDKPLIYNLYDLEKYVDDRGLSYEPYEDYCPGQVVKNAEEMMSALEDFAQGNDLYKAKRASLLRAFHLHKDGKSTARVLDYFEQELGFKRIKH